MADSSKVISKAALHRLPAYLRYLYNIQKQNIENISSTAIAEELNLNPVQVRKDIALISSVAGKPKTGFTVDELIRDLESFLGYDNTHDAILVGVGGLGKAFLGYSGFSNYGLNIVAAFDSNSTIADTTINGKPVYHVDALPAFVRRKNIQIGIITVPNPSAQMVADLLVNSGIKAIWNFANTHLQVPSDIALKNEDLAASLALLSMQLKNKDNTK